jgi:exonuclease SbcD
MKIVHLADTHLGFRDLHYVDARGRNAREQDFYAVFVRAIDKILELQPAAVVHAGDLFHGYHPSAAAVGVALDQVARLRDAGIPIVIISGNHSMPRVAATDHVFKLMERFGGVHAVHAERRVVRLGELAITAVPHCNDRDRLREWITSAEPIADARFNVLVVHLGLEGLGYVGAGEAGSVELSGETLEAVATFDYIALGHLHEFDRPRKNAVYAGSLEPLTWADRSSRKGVVEVDLNADQLDDTYVHQHEIERRKRIHLPPIDASDPDLNLTEAILSAAQRAVGIDDAIVKLSIKSATVEGFGAINRRRVNAAFRSCLHLELDPEFVNGESAAGTAAAPRELRDFIVSYVPRGADPADFIRRTEAYITRASEEMGA